METIAQMVQVKPVFKWKKIASLPNPDGFAGGYAGVSNDALLFTGGTNFPDGKRPWSGGTKTWYDKIFVLENPDGQWKEAGKLPKPMGYGVSLTYKDGVICLGGGDAKQNFSDAFILQYVKGKVKTVSLPSLPFPLINAAGVIMNDVVFVVSGVRSITDTAHCDFICLDLRKAPAHRKWEVLPLLPGATRMLATAGTMNGKIYVFGGVHLVMNEGTSPVREYLKDAWEFTPGKGWKKLADMPHPLAATPSPAYSERRSQLLLFGGDDGEKASQVSTLKDTHPGFRNEILSYNTITNSWSVIDTFPVDVKPDAATNPGASTYAPVTTPLVVWRGNIIIAGGEARPGVRTSKVLMVSPQTNNK